MGEGLHNRPISCEAHRKAVLLEVLSFKRSQLSPTHQVSEGFKITFSKRQVKTGNLIALTV